MAVEGRFCACWCGSVPSMSQSMFLKGHNRRGKTHCAKGHPFTIPNTYLSSTTGKRSCKTCHLEQQRERRQQHPEIYWDTQVKYRYHLTGEDCLSLLAKQNWACPICATPLTAGGKGTVIDHDHNTGQVRALLCKPCNTAIGMVRESPILARSMAVYLEQHSNS